MSQAAGSASFREIIHRLNGIAANNFSPNSISVSIHIFLCRPKCLGNRLRAVKVGDREKANFVCAFYRFRAMSTGRDGIAFRKQPSGG